MATSRVIPSPRLGSVPFGVWLHSLQGAANRDDMRRMVERMVANGVDLLIPCIKQVDGAVDYPSAVARQSDWSRGRDPLQELVDVSKKAGLKVHAWFCVFPEGKLSNLVNGQPELRAIQNHPVKGLQSDKPDLWGESILWSCSNRPEVLEYQCRLMEEVIGRYDVEGIHFDWVRSGFYQCYCKFCQDKCRELTDADLLKEMGNFHPLAHVWYGYRARNVTSLVQRVSEKAHRAGKETSAAVFCTFPLSYNEQAQEWPLWLREEYLDVAMPMTYSTIPAETHYYTVNHVALHRDAGRGELWEGVCSHRIDGELLTRISRNAVNAGAGGLVLFDYPDLMDEKFMAIRAGLR